MTWLRCGAAAALAAIVLAGCATPTESAIDRMGSLGFSTTTATGARYRHLVAQAGWSGEPGAIHVYIEHDGVPWERPDLMSSDPTPRYPLALELMARDAGDRVYLGRACYFGLKGDRGCGARSWTDARYSDDVVQSMAAVVNRIVDRRGKAGEVVLIGYSGGGTIAWLMAAHVPTATAVITVASNLDVAAWTALHQFSPLTGSLDPATQPPLPPSIRQVHMVGGRDTNVPPAITRPVALRQPQAKIVEIPEFDHVCCWLDRWPALLRDALASVAE
jgi:hypothetical protein